MYKSTDFRGTAEDPMRITTVDSSDILMILKASLPPLLKANGIPARLYEEEVRSGGVFGTTLPMVLVKHPDPPSRYFHIGIVINKDILSFVLLGESAQNNKFNKVDSLRERGKLVRSWFINPDEFAMQQEIAWEKDVIGAVKYIFEEVQ